jgi:hypothetical protein
LILAILIKISLVILINITNTVANLYDGILKQYYSAFPDIKRKKTLADIQYPRLGDNFNVKETALINELSTTVHFANFPTLLPPQKNFFCEHVEPIEGAIKAIKEIRSGFDVLLFAKPYENNSDSASDILAWYVTNLKFSLK